ncbi:MAG: CpaF family protein [Dehalococcoidia bacterium]|nr:CpaF family protein [Dehalococcoidia bacterium]MCB9490500.1 CpaF family protein [Dehalococcoidia bacterium]
MTAEVTPITRRESDGDTIRQGFVERIHDQVIRELDLRSLEKLPDDARRGRVEASIGAALNSLPGAPAGVARRQIVEQVAAEVLGLGPIQALLDDPDVSEVMVNGPREVYFERDGVLHEAEAWFRDAEHIRRVADRIVAPLGRRLDETSPMVDARLPDGSRVNVVLPPIAVNSPTITVRKFRHDRFDMNDLVRIGSLSEQAADFLREAVRCRTSILISGGTGSGKTTLLSALSEAIPETERIVTIEDPIEIRLRQRHVVTLEARPAVTSAKSAVTQRDLVRNALRMRPDRIIIGEVRGAEAFDMMQAMNTGHEGSLSTVHANTPRDALSRVENMVMMAGFDLPVTAIREQIASALSLVIQVSRLPDGKRCVTAISEVTSLEGTVIGLQDVFRLERGFGPEGHVQTTLVATGVRPQFADKFGDRPSLPAQR